MAQNLPGPVAAEKEKQQVQVTELYDFVLSTQTLRFTDHHDPIQFFDLGSSPATYTPLAIRREKSESNLDSRVDSIRIVVDNVTKAMSSYIANNEFRGRRLAIRRVFTNLLSDATYFQSVFDGIMDRPIIGNTRAQIEAISRLGFLQRLGPRRMFGLRCGWRFAVQPPDSGCANGVTPAALKDTKASQTVDAGSTATVIQDAARTEADGYWVIGVATMTGGTAANIGVKRRIIASQSGQFTLDLSLPATPQAGDTYDIERDCDLSLDDCSNRFGNQANFGGFPSIPMELVFKG